MARPRIRRSPLSGRVLLTLAVAVLLAAAWIQWRTHSKWPTAPAPDRIRVATYNIRAGLGGLDGIVADLAPLHADLIALQEVEHGLQRARSVDQAGHIAEALGMEAVFAGSFTVDEGEHGIAVLSRYPILGTATLRLPQGNGRWPRVALVVSVDGPLGPFRFVCVHFARPWGWPFSNTLTRLSQIDALFAAAEKESLPLIVAGDLNSLPLSPETWRLSWGLNFSWNPWRDGWGTSFALEAIGFPGGSVKIDHVLHDGHWRSHGTWVAPRGASDHQPVFADLSVR